MTTAGISERGKRIRESRCHTGGIVDVVDDVVATVVTGAELVVVDEEVVVVASDDAGGTTVLVEVPPIVPAPEQAVATRANPTRAVLTRCPLRFRPLQRESPPRPGA